MLVAGLLTRLARGDEPPDPPNATGGAGGAGESVYGTCTERIPEGIPRPTIAESFPAKGFVGYALPLTVTVEHGRGESVLRPSASAERDGVGADALARSGFELPSAEGDAAPTVTALPGNGERAQSRVVISLLALPPTPGRHTLTLPPLPIAVARASGDVMTLCTQPHAIVLDEPTANTPDAEPMDNPPPRRQREEWQAAKMVAYVLPVVLVSALAGALLYRWWRRRPRPVPPPPPPRPPWDVALEDLAALRSRSVLADDHRDDFVDTTSAILRRYLGERYGFDGLEATSREIRQTLRALTPPLTVLPEIDRLLDEADLVKFARVTPSPEDCTALCDLGEAIVHATMPASPTRKPAEATP